MKPARVQGPDKKARDMKTWEVAHKHALETPTMSAEDLAIVPFPLEVVEDDPHLFAVMDAWKMNGVKEVAVDLEFEATLHYPGVVQLCAVQVFDKEKYYLIDGIKLTQPGLTGLKVFFETYDFLKVWFALGSDKSILRTHGYKLLNVYDVQNIPGCGLKGRSLTMFVDILLGEKLFGDVTLPKGKMPRSKKAMQKSNWVTRPIPLDQVVYSLNDVKYLFRLRAAALAAPKVNNPKLASVVPEYADLNPRDKGLALSIYSVLGKHSAMYLKPISEFMNPLSIMSLVRDFGTAFPEKLITKEDIQPYIFNISADKSDALVTAIVQTVKKRKSKKD